MTKPNPISRTFLTLIIAFYLSVPLNIPFIRGVLSGFDSFTVQNCLFIISFFIILILLYNIILSLLLVPYLGKPLISIVILISSFTNYVMLKFGILIDREMIRNVFNSNSHEALDLVTLSSVFWFMFSGVIPVILIYLIPVGYKPIRKEIMSRLGVIILSLVLGASLFVFYSKDILSFGRNHREFRNLVNTINYTRAVITYAKGYFSTPGVYVQVDQNILHTPFEDSALTFLVIVVGETARADRFSVNGYEKNTNPGLAKQDIISFKDAFSCGTSTAYSLPCMFSSYPKDKFDINLAKDTENLVDLIFNSKYDILWKENNDGCKGVCNRIPTVDLVTIPDERYCKQGPCYDEYLIHDFRDYVRDLKKDTVLVLHMLGSHGPTYHKRYPEQFRQFLPSCDTADLSKCSVEEISNTYDNTILYTDHVLSRIIDTLKEFPELESGLIYVSDHGESLGENNIYLHGMPYTIAPKEQKHVPFILWLSETMKQEDYVDYDCLRKLAEQQKISHDNLFSSVLSLLEISSSSYEQSLDIFRSCRTPQVEQRPFTETVPHDSVNTDNTVKR